MVNKYLVLLLLSCTPALLSAQEKDTFARKGLLRMSAAISPGIMIKHRQTNLYIQGDVDYYTDPNISIRGDVYYFTGTQNENSLFHINHSLLFGGVYHLGKKQIDPFVGFQPGISISRLNYNIQGTNRISDKSISPILSMIAGVNYYISTYFNFYFAVRYVNGTHFSNIRTPLSLNEFKISGGLGFNIPLKKP